MFDQYVLSSADQPDTPVSSNSIVSGFNYSAEEEKVRVLEVFEYEDPIRYSGSASYRQAYRAWHVEAYPQLYRGGERYQM